MLLCVAMSVLMYLTLVQEVAAGVQVPNLAQMNARQPQEHLGPSAMMLMLQFQSWVEAADIAADGLDQVYQCCARLNVPPLLRDAVGARLGFTGNFHVRHLALLTDSARIDVIENVSLVDADNDARAPTIFEKSQIRSLFRMADVVAARLVPERAARLQQPRAPGLGRTAD